MLFSRNLIQICALLWNSDKVQTYNYKLGPKTFEFFRLLHKYFITATTGDSNYVKSQLTFSVVNSIKLFIVIYDQYFMESGKFVERLTSVVLCGKRAIELTF